MPGQVVEIQQVRNFQSNEACFNMKLWMYSVVEARAWKQAEECVSDRAFESVHNVFSRRFSVSFCNRSSTVCTSPAHSLRMASA